MRTEASMACVKFDVFTIADQKFWFTQFQIGNYPEHTPNVRFPRILLP